nr:MAG TPA: hypothetical protein [Caudoviricetes sp.]
MKENSIEEDIKSLEDFSNESVLYGSTVGMTLEKYKDLQLSTEHILSDYKKVLKINEVLLKENEELKEDRKNNNVMISLAQNELLNYMSGYEDGKKHKMTAMAQVIENQQYYIVRKQMEKYEERIKMLQKENEELKKFHIQDNKHLDFIMQHSIPVQKVKDKISERQFELQQEYKDFEDDAILIVLQELLEGRK